jgi:dihydroneopterin aldolase/2-amino-4-hydroxy-6-hydroxymethyldihydropteridine diphosphokinase/dihydropteroate synthase
LALLLHLKRIENKLGRIKTIQNGPRVIDLDLTYYGTDTVRIGQKGDREGKWDVPGAGWLEVPHWAIGEREFVLRPLLE